MKTTLLVIGLVLVLLAGCTQTQTVQNNTPPVAGNNQNVTVNPNVTTAGAMVSIRNFAFDPAELTVKAGTAVVWTNYDAVTHQIKSGTFNSQPLGNGETFRFTFDTPGTYEYSCAIHPSMKGKIIVE